MGPPGGSRRHVIPTPTGLPLWKTEGTRAEERGARARAGGRSPKAFQRGERENQATSLLKPLPPLSPASATWPSDSIQAPDAAPSSSPVAAAQPRTRPPAAKASAQGCAKNRRPGPVPGRAAARGGGGQRRRSGGRGAGGQRGDEEREQREEEERVGPGEIAARVREWVSRESGHGWEGGGSSR